MVAAFEQILQGQMQGFPLLNNRLRVQILGFQEYHRRVIGILITPWLINLIMLPGVDDDREALELGHKRLHEFPSDTYKFIIDELNEIDGIGKCQTYSLYSPMGEFLNQDHAVAAARGFLATLMVEREPTEEEQVDEELLGRSMHGEETPEADLDGFAAIELPEPKRKSELSRRELLRGSFMRDV